MFIITDKAKLVGEEVKGVGVMKDEELKQVSGCADGKKNNV